MAIVKETSNVSRIIFPKGFSDKKIAPKRGGISVFIRHRHSAGTGKKNESRHSIPKLKGSAWAKSA